MAFKPLTVEVKLRTHATVTIGYHEGMTYEDIRDVAVNMVKHGQADFEVTDTDEVEYSISGQFEN